MDATLGTKAGRNRGAVSIACLLIAALTLGAEPTSRPSEPQIRTWFNQLADSDGAIREQAVQNLMALPSSDLPLLRKIMEQSRPLLPSQKVVLHDIVVQVFLASLPYAPSSQPFLGIRWPPELDRFDPINGAPVNPNPGLLISERLPGWDSYRMLRDGDVILAVQFEDGTEITIDPKSTSEKILDLTNAVKRYQVGEMVPLRILRDGRQITVRVLLRAKPAELSGPRPLDDPWLEDRAHAGDEYWTKHFADLVGEELS